MRALDFLRRPASHDAPPVALVLGPEELLRSRVCEALVRGAEEECDAYDGPTPGAEVPFDLATFFDALRTPSLFGGRRVVRLRRADKALSDHSDALIRFLASGEAAHRLVMDAETSAPKDRPGAAAPAKGGKSKAAGVAAVIAATEAAGGIVVRCDALYDTPYGGRGPAWESELTRWVVEEAAARGKELRPEDAYRLHQLAGSGLRELAGEIGKLATFTGDRARIDAADVDRLVGASRTAPAFAFGDALAAADVGRALRLSQELFERGVEDMGGKRVVDDVTTAMMMLSAATTRLRKVGAAVDALKVGASFDEAAGAAAIPPFLRDRFRIEVEAWRRRDPSRALAALVNLERALKSGGGPPRVLVDCMVAALLLRGASA
jgi:DNA polymerase III subunit delta